LAKKKKNTEPTKPDYSAASNAVMRGDTLTIEDVKDFIVKAKKKKENWEDIATRSWREIKKRNGLGNLYGGSPTGTTSSRRWVKFPLWWSCLQIRRPITLARLPIPILKDTQGDDPFGRTACVVGERLTRGILKTFDAFPEFSASNDDFLVTNVGWGRVFYRKEECKEDERIRLEVIQTPPPQQDPNLPPEQQPPQQELPPIFLTPDGMQVMDESQIQEDESGPYLLTGNKISIDNEEVYFESGLYSNLYIDADAIRYNKVTRLAFRHDYSYREFKRKFGNKALDLISRTDIDDHKSQGKPIICFEYHDKMLKEVRWFAENSEDFFQPKEIADLNVGELQEVPEDSEEKAESNLDNSDLYGLSGFFPCSAPLIMNNSTDEFWPTPEYFQIMDITDDVNNIVTRMILLTKAIRCRFFFDSSIPVLQQLISETGEGGGIGVPDLERILIQGKGTLQTLVAYLPVDEMITGLKNMYEAFEQRLQMFYNITGLSDLLRGQTPNDGTQKTNGEKQLEAKFALNRMEEPQRKVQEWIKDNYQILMEMALKMFSDESIDEYVTPKTLDEEDRQRYVAALDLLRNNKRRRFRVDFETDSTIAINDQWKRQQAIETANVITKMQESVAKTAETMPELAESQLKLMQHVVGELTDGKLFLDEIKASIEDVIEKVKQPKEPEPNVDMMKVQLEGQKLELEGQKFQFEQAKQATQDQFEQLKIQSNEQIEVAKLQQSERISMIESQLEQFKIQGAQQLESMKVQASSEEARADLEKEYQKISADISLAQQEMSLKRDELLVELRKIADKKEVDQFALMIDARVAGFEEKLATAQLELDKTHGALDIQERFITEQRLQAEHQLQIGHSKIESLEKMMDVALKKKEFDAPSEVKTSEMAAPQKPKRKTSKVVRDKEGNIDKIIHEED
jgi:hypothetical protein